MKVSEAIAILSTMDPNAELVMPDQVPVVQFMENEGLVYVVDADILIDEPIIDGTPDDPCEDCCGDCCGCDENFSNKCACCGDCGDCEEGGCGECHCGCSHYGPEDKAEAFSNEMVDAADREECKGIEDAI